MFKLFLDSNQEGSVEKESPAKAEHNSDIEELKQLVRSLEEKFLEKVTKPSEPSLNEKVKNELSESEKNKNEMKELEDAISFNYQSDSFLVENKDLLPSNIEKIFEVSKKENYENVKDRANDLKSAIVQEFFSVQDNLDLLTEGQKIRVLDYMKLTKDAKIKNANELYKNIFEPTLGTKKRIAKAEQLAKSRLNEKYGYAEGSTSEKAFENRMKELSEKFYLGGK